MPKYMTKQRKTLLAFLAHHADEALSAKQIAALLNDDSISISAVYRNLSALEQEGKIRRVSKSGSREVFYQYTDCSSCKDCLHLSCEKCGKTYHMNMSDADRLVRVLAQNDEFSIDLTATVLYGICKNCKQQG
jgi:Fur family ferric uptake transcriptional regulator